MCLATSSHELLWQAIVSSAQIPTAYACGPRGMAYAKTGQYLEVWTFDVCASEDFLCFGIARVVLQKSSHGTPSPFGWESRWEVRIVAQ